MDKPELYELLDRAEDQASFFRFVEALIEDRADSVRREAAGRKTRVPAEAEDGGWQNSTIESFLDAGLAWARATYMGRNPHELGQPPSWRHFASFLYSGKIYE